MDVCNKYNMKTREWSNDSRSGQCVTISFEHIVEQLKRSGSIYNNEQAVSVVVNKDGSLTFMVEKIDE